MRRRFSGPAAREGVQTGDGRLIVDGAAYWEGALPQAYQWDRSDEGGHYGAVEVGMVESYERRDGGVIWCEGWIDDEAQGPDGSNWGAELIRRMGEGMTRGVSIVPDDVEVQYIDTTLESTDDDGDAVALLAAAGDPDPGDEGVVMFEYNTGDFLERWTRVRIRALTAVDVPAFADCYVDLVDDAAEGDGEEGTEAEGDETEPEAAGQPAAVVAAGGSGDAAGAPAAACCDSCAAAAAHGGRALAQVAAATATTTRPRPLAVAVDPPAAFFQNPHLPLLSPLTWTREGRVMGHIAPWGQCHTGSPMGECVLTPRSYASYAYFLTGSLLTAEGQEIPVGQLTIGGGHADTRLSYRGTLDHYDNVAAAWADVTCGEDQFGIWIAGALRPGMSAERLREIRAASPSGDWRLQGGNLELAAVHSVNVPGYPISQVAAGAPVEVPLAARARVVDGRVTALVAAGAEVMRRVRSAQATASGDSPAVRALSARLAALEAQLSAPDRDALRAIGAERDRRVLRSLRT